MSHSYSFRKVYGAATIINVITCAGLLFALFGDGLWDGVSWIALLVPLTVLVWKIPGKASNPSVNKQTQKN